MHDFGEVVHCARWASLFMLSLYSRNREQERPVPSKRELLTSNDVAVQCGVDPSTVRWWRKTGRLQPFAVSPRGQAFYRRIDIDRWIRRRQREAAESILSSGDAA